MKKKYTGLYLIFASTLLLYTSNQLKACTYDVAVIGAGPGGIAAVGNLIDANVKTKSIVWIDPYFAVGHLGRFYQNVPSNTKIKLLTQFFYGCESFEFEKCRIFLPILHKNPEMECMLSEVIQPLQWITNQLRNKVSSIKGLVKEITREHNYWKIQTKHGNVHAKKIILATGSNQKKLVFKHLHEIYLADALDEDTIKSYVQEQDVVAVFGTSHSGILVLKNLAGCPVKKVISFSKKPLCYAEYKGDYFIHDNTGLKGVAAAWAREVFEKNPPVHFVKKDLNTLSDAELEQELTGCTKVIYAIGLTQNHVPGITIDILKSYDATTSVIAPNLFGIGIAFPERVLDASGAYEFNGGIVDFMTYAKRCVPLWVEGL